MKAILWYSLAPMKLGKAQVFPVSEGSTVRWKVKNPAGDRLSKIGQGTLLVNGKGENLGDISVGDGVVVLNQQADEQGKTSL